MEILEVVCFCWLSFCLYKVFYQQTYQENHRRNYSNDNDGPADYPIALHSEKWKKDIKWKQSMWAMLQFCSLVVVMTQRKNEKSSQTHCCFTVCIANTKIDLWICHLYGLKLRLAPMPSLASEQPSAKPGPALMTTVLVVMSAKW